MFVRCQQGLGVRGTYVPNRDNDDDESSMSNRSAEITDTRPRIEARTDMHKHGDNKSTLSLSLSSIVKNDPSSQVSSVERIQLAALAAHPPNGHHLFFECLSVITRLCPAIRRRRRRPRLSSQYSSFARIRLYLVISSADHQRAHLSPCSDRL